MKPLSQEDKANIYNILAEAYIDLIRQNLIGRFERRVLSRKILDNVGKAKTYEEVSAFIKVLLVHYPVFRNASVRIDAAIGQLHEAQIIGRLQQFIHTKQ